MLTDKLKYYLKENADQVLPEYRDIYFSRLKELGFSEAKNSSFIEFMIKYSDEHYGSEGCLGDFMLDVKDFKNSRTMSIRKNNNTSEKYFSLFCGESDDFLLYNIEDDSVKLIEAQNIKQLSNDEYCDKKWNSFNNFLEDFFELN